MIEPLDHMLSIVSLYDSTCNYLLLSQKFSEGNNQFLRIVFQVNSRNG